MRNADSERKIFWEMYNQILAKHGKPYIISSKKQWAIVNKNTANWNEPAIAMDFLVQKRLLRINLFLLDDVALFNKLSAIKHDLEDKLGCKSEWVHGEKGKDTYRIKTELGLVPYDHDDYYRVIEESLPIVINYINTFRPYINC